MPESPAATVEVASPSSSTPIQVVCGRSALADAIALNLGGTRVSGVAECDTGTPVVYAPPRSGPKDDRPDIEDARRFFVQCRAASMSHVVLVSSTSVYGPSHHHPGLITEDRICGVAPKNHISKAWLEVEALAALSITSPARLTIVRACPTLSPGGTDYFSCLVRSRVAPVVAGFDPMLQFITARTLALAIGHLTELGAQGPFNIAPSQQVSLRGALRCSGTKRVPVPATLHAFGRRVLAALRLAHGSDQMEHIRYHWTAANDKFRENTGTDLPSSAEAIAEFNRVDGARPAHLPDSPPDAFGMDKRYIAAYGRTLFRFMHDVYWRIEERGIENIPSTGRAVLAGVHRGFMPFDGVMTLHSAATRRGRYPRFLIHPSLLKFPYLFDFMTRLGGIMACQENANYILERDGIVAVFPEGIRGAFTLYRDAYRLGKFGRDEFVRIALRNRAPIVPFVTVGSAEIFPVFRRVEWGWCKRLTEWPYLPLTPTFPLLPVPLPSKWHTAYLEPLHIEEQYGPEAAEDTAIVRAISREVRNRMQQALDDMRARRRHIFFGSLTGGI